PYLPGRGRNPVESHPSSRALGDQIAVAGLVHVDGLHVMRAIRVAHFESLRRSGGPSFTGNRVWRGLSYSVEANRAAPLVVVACVANVEAIAGAASGDAYGFPIDVGRTGDRECPSVAAQCIGGEEPGRIA